MGHRAQSRGLLTFTRAVSVAAVAAAALMASAAHAGGTPEQKCQKGRYDAAAKYASCQQKALGKLFGGAPLDEKFEAALSKCRVKYTNTWAKLVAKGVGSTTCVDPRYDTTSAPGTVIDRLTELQWEKKTDDATVHDKDNLYSWSATPSAFFDATGTAFTTFLATLNSGVCFAGHCDWRLPTISELQTILLEPYPCSTSPCIDQAAFGPTVADRYSSATTCVDIASDAWGVFFPDGSVFRDDKSFYVPYSVRAVRAGL